LDLLPCSGGVYFGARTGGFASDINDVGALLKQMERVFDSFVAIEELAAIREGIRRDVHDAHDQRALAKREYTRPDIPLEDGTHRADSKSLVIASGQWSLAPVSD